MGNEFLMIEAAAEGGKPKVIGLAYSGGKMSIPGWKYPIVVDLAGMQIPEQVPLLLNHENRTSSRVGMISAKIEQNTLTIEGEIVAKGEQADGIVEQAKAGADWQLSIGAEVLNSELVKDTRVVNGQENSGPFFHIQKSVLREVSVVSVGADMSTRMKVAASFSLTPKEGEDMGKEKSPEAGAVNPEMKTEKPKTESQIAADGDTALKAVQMERERVGKIQAICSGEYNEIERQAISAGWTPEETSQKVLKAIRDGRPAADVNIIVKRRPQGSVMRKSLEAAMCLRIGISEAELLAQYGDEALDRGYDMSDMPMKQVLVECLNMEGINAPSSFGNETIQAAFSTVSLPGILSNVANKKLLQSYNAQPVIATKLCSTGDLNDFKENDRFRLTDAGDLQAIGADGELKGGGLSEERATNQLDTYGKKFCLTRKMIINDDVGAFMKVPIAMGNRAARLIDQLFFKRLLANPKQNDTRDLFSTEHKNILTGPESVLAAEGLRKAVQAFLDQTDSDGQPINIEPRYLLVPTSLKHAAIELTKGATLIIAGGGETPSIRPALNSLVDENLQVVSSPYLANSLYTGGSEKAWYLFGDPNQVDTFEIGFLKGNRTPKVEKGDTDFNTLGLWFRVYFDLGIREQDHRGMVKSVGQ